MVMKLKQASGNLFIKAKINGRLGWMLLDTGCSGTSLDSAFAKKAGFKRIGRGFGHDATASLGIIPIVSVNAIDIGTIHLTRLKCAVTDYKHLRENFRIDFVGILGAELFRGRKILLDTIRNELSQVRRVPRSFQRRLAISQFVHGIPVVGVTVGQRQLHSVVDTGNGKVPIIVYSSRQMKYLQKSYPRIGCGKQSGASGKQKVKTVVLSCPVKFAGVMQADVKVVCQASRRPFDTIVQGNIGLPLFRGRRILFDYPHRLIHVE